MHIFLDYFLNQISVSLKNIAGNAVTGNIAEGTYAKICLTIGSFSLVINLRIKL